MASFVVRVFVFAVVLTVSPQIFAQQMQVIRVCVPVMKNTAGRSVPVEPERDRLVKALNDEKPDKKVHVKVVGVALEGTDREDVEAQAVANKCDYAVYTRLTELKTQGDPEGHRPGSVNITGANGQKQTAEDATMSPQYVATVEYKLYRTGEATPVSAAPFTAQDALGDTEVVGQVMDRIANRVFDLVKKRSAAPLCKLAEEA
jgi:hypothetical protein